MISSMDHEVKASPTLRVVYVSLFIAAMNVKPFGKPDVSCVLHAC
jgi:hypothetical protein